MNKRAATEKWRGGEKGFLYHEISVVAGTSESFARESFGACLQLAGKIFYPPIFNGGDSEEVMSRTPGIVKETIDEVTLEIHGPTASILWNNGEGNRHYREFLSEVVAVVSRINDQRAFGDETYDGEFNFPLEVLRDEEIAFIVIRKEDGSFTVAPSSIYEV